MKFLYRLLRLFRPKPEPTIRVKLNCSMAQMHREGGGFNVVNLYEGDVIDFPELEAQRMFFKGAAVPAEPGAQLSKTDRRWIPA